MTIPQLMEFGFTKANLLRHLVLAENEILIQKLMSLDVSTMGSTLNEQVKAYVFQLYQDDLKHFQDRARWSGQWRHDPALSRINR